MVHMQNQHEQKRSNRHTCCLVNQTNRNSNDHLMCANPPTVLLENGTMVHGSNKHRQKETETIMLATSLIWLENGSLEN